MFRENIHGRDIELVLARREKFTDQLRAADALYIHGGGTEELYDSLKGYPDFIELVRKKKLVVGSSAGAYVLARYSLDYAEGSVVRKRFGILPIKIHCHFDPVKRARIIEQFKAVDPENALETVLLKDCETRIYFV